MQSKKSNREGTGKFHPCAYCNNPTQLYRKYCNIECYNKDHNVIIKCLECNKEKKVPKNKKDTIYCSIQCANKNLDRKETNKKAKETLKLKYNTNNPFEIKGYKNLDIKRNGKKISETLKSKSQEEKNTIKQKIKITNSQKTQEEKNTINEKKKQTNKQRYGVECTLSKNSPFRDDSDKTIRQNQLNKYNKWLLEHDLVLLDEFIGVKDKESQMIYYNFKHIPSGNIFIDHLACGRLPVYRDPKETRGTSIPEKELQNFIRTLLPDSEYIFNNRKLVKGFEIDVYIPSHNLAIEFNGNRYHSELMGKTRLYHLYKTEECEKQNIQLIHIFEDEWKNKKDIIKSKIKNQLNQNDNKIYARKCVIKEINNFEKNKFLNENHIQGEDKSKIKLGLFHNNELVSLITFGNLRKITGHNSKENHYELIRFCTKLNFNIIGGFSKLLKYFIKNYNPKEILSYADRRWSKGKLYENNNFKFISNTPPNYWYMKYYKSREHRYKYRKSELNKILPIFDASISEWENMKLNKYDRIWDCGSKKYILSIT